MGHRETNRSRVAWAILIAMLCWAMFLIDEDIRNELFSIKCAKAQTSSRGRYNLVSGGTVEEYTINNIETTVINTFTDNPPFYFNNETSTETDWWMGVPLVGGSADGVSNDGIAVGIATNDTGFGTNKVWGVDPNGLMTLAAVDNPDVVDVNQVAIDVNDFAIVMFDGSAKYYAAQKIKPFSMTIYDPNTIEVADANIPVMAVEPNMFPGGITIVSLGFKTSATNTCTVTFKDYNSPTDASPDTLEAITLTAGTEVGDDGTLTNSALAPGDIMYAILSGVEDTSTFLQLWGTYYVNTND